MLESGDKTVDSFGEGLLLPPIIKIEISSS
jgi:hypothetical protein